MSMRLTGILTVVAIAFACGGATIVAQTPVYRAGSRLRPIVITNGVVSQFERAHDTQLDMDCQFVVLADGKLHCAPMVTTNGVYFADAACTEGLAPRGKKYQLRTPVGAACGTPDVIEIDNAATALVAYESNGSKCTPVAAKTESYVRVKRVVP